MNEQVAQFDVGVTHIGTKNVFTEKVVELPARRMFLEKFTVLMTRAGEGVISHLYVLAQGIEKRWQQVVFVVARRRFQLQPVLIFAVDNGRDAIRPFLGFTVEQKYRQVKARPFEQSQNAATALCPRNDDCRHIRKVGAVEGHLFTVRRQGGDQLSADGNFHCFHKHTYPFQGKKGPG